MPVSPLIDRAGAIARYTEIAERLPSPSNPQTVQYVPDLVALADEFDVFVLDGFGVINIGNRAIPGALESVAQLQASGKRVMVLTNGATMPIEKTRAKYADWGFNFSPNDVISSRLALQHALQDHSDETLWGVVATPYAQIEQLASRVVLLGDNPQDYANATAFIFLSASEWNDEHQRLLFEALSQHTRPMLVGNPDLVAPHEHGMSLEPGFYAHALADAGVCHPRFYGKPFPLVFDMVAQRIPSVPPHRIAMVGDTLHTDILGGSSYGWRTVMVKNHGLMSEASDSETMALTGIRPDFIAATT